MPNVPNAPGVPALVNNDPPPAPTLEGDNVSDFSTASNRWGIYRNGVSVIDFDTVLSTDYRIDWAIADFPLEGGKFESYDKVDLPFNARVRFASGGSEEKRRALINSVRAIAGDLEFYQVNTPDDVYASCNVQHFDYRRTSTNGAGMIIIEVWLQEIRVQGATNPTAVLTGNGVAGSLNTQVTTALTTSLTDLLGNPLAQFLNMAASNVIRGPVVNALLNVTPSLLTPSAFNPVSIGAVQAQVPLASIIPAANTLLSFLGAR